MERRLAITYAVSATATLCTACFAVATVSGGLFASAAPSLNAGVKQVELVDDYIVVKSPTTTIATAPHSALRQAVVVAPAPAPTPDATDPSTTAAAPPPAPAPAPTEAPAPAPKPAHAPAAAPPASPPATDAPESDGAQTQPTQVVPKRSHPPTTEDTTPPQPPHHQGGNHGSDTTVPGQPDS